MYSRGVTLLELLIALAVIGVIAAFAVPAYQRHLMRVHRTEATIALYAVATAQERFHLRHGSYSAELSAQPPAGLGMNARSDGGRYVLSISLAADGQSFIATATPSRDGSQASDAECQAFSLDHRGRRAISGAGESAACWR
jgi:type IV pilus assembly protein PilE